MVSTDRATTVAAVRAFSRFYTKWIGVLHEGLLGSQFSLAEARLIWELATRGEATAAAVAVDLSLDPGYLSRMIRRLEGLGVIARTAMDSDARQQRLSLTQAGRAAFAQLDQQSRHEIATLLASLSQADCERLQGAMATIQDILTASPRQRPPVVLRPPVPGDLTWSIHRQTRLYHEEFGWTRGFEPLVAEITHQFLTTARPGRDAGWMAEVGGEIVGSVLVVGVDERTAKLRMLYVEQQARGLGVGRALVQAAIDFARAAGYHEMVLWTNDVLTAARALYVAFGFELIASEPHDAFGPPMQSETWRLALRSAA